MQSKLSNCLVLLEQCFFADNIQAARTVSPTVSILWKIAPTEMTKYRFCLHAAPRRFIVRGENRLEYSVKDKDDSFPAKQQNPIGHPHFFLLTM